MAVHATDGGGHLATHPRAPQRGTWVTDPAHFDGLPDGHTRATVIDFPTRPDQRADTPGGELEPAKLPGADVVVAIRPLTDYAAAAAAQTVAR